MCELGGSAGRYPAYAAMLSSLYDRQVTMYQVILETGAATGIFTLAQPAVTIARNIVALEDAYGYRMVARHPAIDHATATRLILDYARLSTTHPLDHPAAPTRRASDEHAALTVLFLPESAYGPTNQCIGLGDLLLAPRAPGGVRVRVVVGRQARARSASRSSSSTCAAPDPDAGEEDAGQFWTDFIAETAPEFRKPTIEQLETLRPADLPGARRRSDVRRAAAARDHRDRQRPT